MDLDARAPSRGCDRRRLLLSQDNAAQLGRACDGDDYCRRSIRAVCQRPKDWNGQLNPANGTVRCVGVAGPRSQCDRSARNEFVSRPSRGGVCVLVQPKGAGALPSDWHSYSTDGSWRTSLEVNRDWASSVTSDSHWKPAQVFGILGETAPWDRRERGETDGHFGESTFPHQ